MTDFAALLRSLASAEVEFIIVGGVAAVAHGSPRATGYRHSSTAGPRENLARLAAAMTPHRPYLRGAPPGLPFRFDAQTLAGGLNFTLITEIGWIDLLGEITGGGKYENLLAHPVAIEAFGVSCRVVDLETLIAMKRAAGRPKDFEAVSDLELLRDRR